MDRRQVEHKIVQGLFVRWVKLMNFIVSVIRNMGTVQQEEKKVCVVQNPQIRTGQLWAATEINKVSILKILYRKRL